MKIEINIFRYIPLVLLSGLPVVFFDDLYLYIIEENYFILAALFVLAIVVFKSFAKNNTEVKLTNIDIISALYIGYNLIHRLIFDEIIDYVNLVTTLLLSALYIIIRRKYKRQSIGGYINIMALVVGLELLFAYLQLFDIIPNLQANMPFGGSFANPAPFSMFIASAVPFVLYSLLENKEEHKIVKVLKLLFIVSAITLLVIGQIRSSWVILLCGCCGVLVNKYKLLSKFKSLKTPLRVFVILTVTLVFVFGSIGLFNLKKDSAIGRFFIWSNTLDVISDSPVLGHGAGSFEYNYNIAQSSRFASGEYTEQQFLLADEVKMAYNDILQITSELGLVGGLLFILLLYTVARSVVKYHGDKKSDQVLVASVLFAMIIGGLFSYPLTIIKTQALFVFCLAILSEFSDVRFNFVVKRTVYLKSLKMLSLSAVFLLLILESFQIVNYNKWKNALNTIVAGNKVHGYEQLQQIYPYLKHDPAFVLNYTSVFMRTKQHGIVWDNIEYLDRHYNDYGYLLMKADFYKAINNQLKAIEYNEAALMLIPSRFIPRYNLLDSYNKIGEREKAFNIAHEIINTPIKIYGTTVEQIQNYAKSYLGIEK